ncbi:hypothetical protein WR25_19780 [Diploscapter pachys]|uniref:Tyrosine-protein kinase n=1 Tax=Diploscapter pachys TaxID=2018661 RepID=A0A2A2L8N1_9BILA|nr:hypothetical protein WR25_19780 [Diploscapter pachys]
MEPTSPRRRASNELFIGREMTAEDEESIKKLKKSNSQMGNNKSTRSSTSLVDPPTPGDITNLNLETIATPSPLTAKPDEFDDEKELMSLPCYHGYIAREDLTNILSNTGDYLIRRTILNENRNKPDAKPNFLCEVILSVFTSTTEQKNLGKGTKSQTKKTKQERVTNLVTNILLRREGKQWQANELKFDTIQQLLDHFTKTDGFLKAKKFRLKTPVTKLEWEFSHSDVTVGKMVGEGAYGEVFCGTLRLKNGQVVDCAIKMMKNMEQHKTRERIREMMKEARLMRHLKHVNIVSIYGVAVDQQPPFLLLEFITGGSLIGFLKKAIFWNTDLTTELKIKMCLDAARGIEYIHKMVIIHRDIAARNCLITRDKVVKITDFGLSKQGTSYRMMDRQKLAPRWLAPEALMETVWTSATDVYAFGILVYEIWTNCKQPYEGLTPKAAKNRITTGQFLTLPPSCPSALSSYVAQKIFVYDLTKRAAMSEVVQTLERISKMNLSTMTSPAIKSVRPQKSTAATSLMAKQESRKFSRI